MLLHNFLILRLSHREALLHIVLLALDESLDLELHFLLLLLHLLRESQFDLLDHGELCLEDLFNFTLCFLSSRNFLCNIGHIFFLQIQFRL